MVLWKLYFNMQKFETKPLTYTPYKQHSDWEPAERQEQGVLQLLPRLPDCGDRILLVKDQNKASLPPSPPQTGRPNHGRVPKFLLPKSSRESWWGSEQGLCSSKDTHIVSLPATCQTWASAFRPLLMSILPMWQQAAPSLPEYQEPRSGFFPGGRGDPVHPAHAGFLSPSPRATLSGEVTLSFGGLAQAAYCANSLRTRPRTFSSSALSQGQAPAPPLHVL